MKLGQEASEVVNSFADLCTEIGLSIDTLKKIGQITNDSKSLEERVKRVKVLYKIVQRDKDESEIQRHLEEYKRDLGIA